MLWLPVLLLPVLYILLIRPSLRRRFPPVLTGRGFAHRGLWNEKRPENTLSAFRSALEAGYGMEMDIRLSSDGVPVILHDPSLRRVFGTPENVSDCPLSFLSSIHAPGTREHVPTLQEVLDLVSGQVPLILEIKSCRPRRAFLRSVQSCLDAYPGMYVVESFDPLILLWYRLHRPHVIRGQLAFGLHGPRSAGFLPCLQSLLLQHVLSRPDFIAFDFRTEPSLPLKLVRLFRPVTAAWTLRSEEELKSLRASYDLWIFEGFRPR